MIDKSKVLIVGAGAGGFVTGYHLTLSGAEVTFYVRPNRLQELQPPQRLYCYDDCELKLYSDYQLISDMKDVASKKYDFVLVTLDGHTAFSREGGQLLTDLGEAIADTGAVVVNLGVGVDIKEYFVEKTGLPEQRILCGTFSFFSHFVAGADNQKIAHPPVKPHDLAKARMAYRHLDGKGGLIIDNKSRQAAKQFSELYSHSGVSHCKTVKPIFINMMFNLLFPFFAVCELGSWPPIEKIVKDKTLWPLASKAVSEISALPRFGILGRITSKLMRVSVWRRVWLKMEKDCLPLDFNGFNQLHHGNKVAAQDIEVMQHNLAMGEKSGIEMPNLKELLTRLEAFRQ